MRKERILEIPDIITGEETSDLIDYYSSLEPVPKTKTIRSVTSIEKTSFYYIVDRFKERLGDFKVVAFYFLDSLTPFPVHSDFGIGLNNVLGIKTDNYPYYTALIPLEFQQDMYTVVFNESSYEGPQWANKDWSPCWHLPEINNKFTDFEKELLTHACCNMHDANHQKNCYSKLSIGKIAKWISGTAICWPRNLLHCSGYFDGSLGKRISLVIWFGLENP